MATIFDYLLSDHRRCDILFDELSRSIVAHQWALASHYHAQFVTSFASHIDKEETLFFPRLKQAVSGSDWLISELTIEHERLRTLLARVGKSVRDNDQDEFFLHAESFLLLMREHSKKEEEILYPAVEKRFGCCVVSTNSGSLEKPGKKEPN